MKRNILKFLLGTAGFVAVSALGGPAARATDLLKTTGSLTTASPAELGRESRDTTGANDGYAQFQTWTPSLNGETAYRGAANTTTTYYYTTYTFTPAQLGNGQYVEIDFNEPSVNDLFASAWTSYNGTQSISSGTGWLGDAGQSENFQGLTDARFFQVVVPAGQSLVVVINSTSNAALGEVYGLQVEAYSDTQYTDAVPEPSTWALLGAGVLAGGVVVVRRRRASV